VGQVRQETHQTNPHSGSPGFAPANVFEAESLDIYMAANHTQLHVLAYDISMDPGRLARVHREVRKWGFPLQYSVFLIPGKPSQIRELLSELESIIDPRLDDIRVYPLPANVDIVQLGRGSGVDGMDLFQSNASKPPVQTLVV
jgi:CRISPR-associated protein Cas2